MERTKNGFSLLRARELPEIGAVLHEMEHDKTGAKLLWLEREDDNKTFGIAFTTLPEDSTGVPHIMEHSVLCGSDKYPVKEPFVELLKNSMNTFLNAMTFPDKTVYPVSSRNGKDFINLMRVYLDAVFHPLIYSKPEIFYQEGWHYEFDGDGKPSYKGVVFNEMKGAYASPDELLGEAVMQQLFPDNCYRFSSGGDPEVIPDLSYKAFLNFHRRCYAPSNSYIFLDGDMDIDAVLAIIDGEYLSHYERSERLAPPALQPCVNGGEKRIAYELAPNEEPAGKMRLATAGVIGTYEDKETVTAMQLLSQLLCGSNQSPLSRCILEKGLAEDVVMQVQDGMLQPWVQLEVKNYNAANQETIRETLTAELKRLADEGLDREQLTAIMANLEFKLREKDYGTMPRGLIFGFNVLESWLYGGDPAQNLEIGDLFVSLREKLEQGWFEDLLRRMLLENPHSCTVIMEPSHSVGEERREKEQQRLSKEAAGWTEAEKQELLTRQARIQAWQESEDTPENLATLPRLQLSDISAEPESLPTERLKIAGLPVCKHEVACGGIVYASLYFDIADRDAEALSLVSLLGELLGELRTETCSPEELINRRKLLLGSLHCTVNSYAKENQIDGCERKLCVSFSTLESNLEKALALVTEILTQTRFDSESQVLNLLRQKRIAISQRIVMGGNQVAMGRLAAQNSVSGVAAEHSGGFCYYQWLKKQEDNWDWTALRAALEQTCKDLFCTSRLALSVTGTLAHSEETLAQGLAQALPTGSTGEKAVLSPWGLRREGIQIPADISFAVRGGSILDHGGSYNGLFALAARIIRLGYLWNVIRVQGGAYGTSLNVQLSGLAGCSSFRDPNAARSLEQYEGAADFLRSLCAQQADLTGFIIGAVSDDSPLLSPRLRGVMADSRTWSGLSEKTLRQHRKELLEATHEQLAAVADILDGTVKTGGVCVIGSQPLLEACQLDEILSL